MHHYLSVWGIWETDNDALKRRLSLARPIRRVISRVLLPKAATADLEIWNQDDDSYRLTSYWYGQVVNNMYYFTPFEVSWLVHVAD